MPTLREADLLPTDGTLPLPLLAGEKRNRAVRWRAGDAGIAEGPWSLAGGSDRKVAAQADRALKRSACVVFRGIALRRRGLFQTASGHAARC